MANLVDKQAQRIVKHVILVQFKLSISNYLLGVSDLSEDQKS